MIVKKHLVFLGAPGTGKGTLSQLFKARLNFDHLSTGDLFRKMIKAQNHLSELLNSYMQEGKYVPDELTNEVVKESLAISNDHDGQQLVILDGYPRTLEQAQYLQTLLEIDAAILLQATDIESIITRLTNRLVCLVCQKVYNSSGEKRPKVEGVCDDDGSVLAIRKDDNKEVIRKRIVEYDSFIKPVIDFYKNKNLLHVIDANHPSEAIYEAALKIIMGEA